MMLRTILKSLSVVVACVALLGASSTVFAQGYGHGHNHGYSGSGYSGYRGSGYSGYRGSGYRSSGYSQSYRHYPSYHNTSHYDYHPGGYQPHGNHYDYVPGHYDYHRTGHYHW